ncbi:TIGR03668 family PPOX class F420-dependent oxidoreductase [Streptomyces sp. NPDC090108]|uniref:TIGR03668 family PPOX class F420-dependent oxidoreductase n=1 Tax=Streptomyces sp. NPDC090108 TaxID=3365947 RepID=UPI00380988F0
MPALNAAEARRRFTRARVARLATVDAAGRPHQVPVVFARLTEGGTDRIVTAVDHKPKTTADLRRLANIAAHPAVCLLADAYDEDWAQLWWGRVDGEADVLAPRPEASGATGTSAPATGATPPPRGPGAAAGAGTAAPGGTDEREGEPEDGREDARDPAERRVYDAAVEALCAKYPQYRERPPTGPVIAVTVRRWTGWEARRPGPDA